MKTFTVRRRIQFRVRRCLFLPNPSLNEVYSEPRCQVSKARLPEQKSESAGKGNIASSERDGDEANNTSHSQGNQTQHHKENQICSGTKSFEKSSSCLITSSRSTFLWKKIHHSQFQQNKCQQKCAGRSSVKISWRRRKFMVDVMSEGKKEGLKNGKKNRQESKN